MAGRNDPINGNGVASNGRNAAAPAAGLSHSGGGLYEIRVKGQLNSRWSEWLEGLEVRLSENGEMILYGPIVDQAALMGVLNKLGSLNLMLLSVNQLSRPDEEKDLAGGQK